VDRLERLLVGHLFTVASSADTQIDLPQQPRISESPQVWSSWSAGHPGIPAVLIMDVAGNQAVWTTFDAVKHTNPTHVAPSSEISQRRRVPRRQRVPTST